MKTHADHMPCSTSHGTVTRSSRAVTRGSLLVPLLILLFLSACSTAPIVTGPVEPPLRRYEDLVKPGQPNMLEVKDEVEGFNRGSYRFNYYFDEYLYRPVVRGYEFIMPNYLEDRVSDAIDNLGEFTNLTNNLMQFNLKAAGITVSRFVINSTVGVGGLWDQAKKMGLKRQTEDFGLTLGHYGAGSGSYLMLPVLGASNVRDTTGLVADLATSNYLGPVAWINDTTFTYAYSGIYAVDRRHRTPFRYRQTGSPFEYELIRSLYTMKRDYDISQTNETK
ncbi:VacJ family lipoprotein [Geomonas paludis]|uniref:VacJ family lipoprotein n=1 Tax=Geomonas paludis TaxID=2740185 RepID=A0ABY4LJ33_9BACT|nr:VacJ family lipoprotein [Geomonas paludis]UPU37989.1 VacJ family lipoprotein [Geomonas paludis]